MNTIKLTNISIFLVLICVCLIFFILILPYFDKLNNSDSEKLNEEFQNLNFSKLNLE